MSDRRKLRESLLTVPEQFRGGLQRWIECGLAPGSFLCALLSNDLHGTLVRARAESWAVVPELVTFLRECAPEHCWGSAEAMVEWQRRGGLDGIEQAQADVAREG